MTHHAIKFVGGAGSGVTVDAGTIVDHRTRTETPWYRKRMFNCIFLVFRLNSYVLRN